MGMFNFDFIIPTWIVAVHHTNK